MSREGVRLISAARFDRWEARIAGAIGEALASQEARALATLRSVSAAAVPTDAFDEASWDTAVDGIVKPAAAGVMAEVLRIVTSVIPEGVTIPTIDLAPHVGALVNKVMGIGPQVAADLTASLTEGAMLGESVSALEDRVRSLFASTEARAHTIARTSVVPAANGATHEAMAAVHAQVVPLDKEWLSAGDSRVRSDHAEADGQRVPFDQTFTVGGESLKYPGDPVASASQSVNCRCTTIMWEQGTDQQPTA